MAEREDFIQASVSQAQTIAELQKRVKCLTDDLEAANEQLSVQALISESRARQVEEGRAREEQQALKINKLRSSVRVLWGLHQQMQMRLRDQQESVAAGNEVSPVVLPTCLLALIMVFWPARLLLLALSQLLESLSELLSERKTDGEL